MLAKLSEPAFHPNAHGPGRKMEDVSNVPIRQIVIVAEDERLAILRVKIGEVAVEEGANERSIGILIRPIRGNWVREEDIRIKKRKWVVLE
jgi:hypothetical protein